jgi:hypothetical protein
MSGTALTNYRVLPNNPDFAWSADSALGIVYAQPSADGQQVIVSANQSGHFDVLEMPNGTKYRLWLWFNLGDPPVHDPTKGSGIERAVPYGHSTYGQPPADSHNRQIMAIAQNMAAWYVANKMEHILKTRAHYHREQARHHREQMAELQAQIDDHESEMIAENLAATTADTELQALQTQRKGA